MRTPSSRTRSMLLPLAASLLLGCNAKDLTKPHDSTPNYPPAISADSTLAALRMAYVGRDLTEYMSLFADSFKFVVAPMNLVRDPSLPVEWRLNVERRIHDRMFHRADVERIALSFTHPYTAVPDSTTVPGQRLWKVRLDGIRLDVFEQSAIGPIDYQVASGTAEFYFEEDAAHPIQGLPAWKIVLWRDEPSDKDTASNRTAIVGATWGQVKRLFLE